MEDLIEVERRPLGLLGSESKRSVLVLTGRDPIAYVRS